jgi:hypothetical protein
MREKRNPYEFLVEKSEGKRPLGTLTIRSENNIKIDLKILGEGVDWVYLAQDADQ